ncbi:MAG: Ca2+-binding EF-hand superfamily protein [Rhodothermales bacterium]|jgi:Ca2+-binding EF-hand superfamily protein
MKCCVAIFAISASLWAQLPFSGFDHDDDLLLSPQEVQLATDEFLSGLDAFQATVMERFDSDGDGSLSADEHKSLAASGSTNLGALVQRFDSDNDGLISVAERTAAVQDFGNRLAAQNRDTMARFDADKDGIISPGERDGLELDVASVLNAFGREGFGRRGPRMGPPDWVNQHDRDGDLIIDEVEEWFALEGFRDTMRERVSRQLDTDGDGEVSDDEIAGFVAEAWRDGRENEAQATLQRLQGVIDPRFLEPVQKRVKAWNADIRKRFDEDRDGWLNEAEARIARERLANEPMQR